MKNVDWEKLAFEFQTTSISLTKLGEREKIDRRTISKHFKELGIEVINKQNKPKFNEHIFDSIDTEEKAYWLGFIFADGYIGSTPIRNNKKSIYNFELSLGIKDLEHLKKFKDFINFEKEITIDSYRCRIMIANKHFWNTLNDLGCTPRKSLSLNFPKNISSILLKHFIRGYFDGDGCITRHVYVHTVTPVISILGTKVFLEEILKHSNTNATFRHDKRHSVETLTLEWSKEEGIKFINYLYNNSSIYLDRKFKLFEIFKNGSRSVEEFTELLEGNIGETPEKDNSEITYKIKKL